jgi:hypothetical protein
VASIYVTPEAIAALRKGEPIPSGTVLTMVQYKAQLDAKCDPVKDANGRFVKGDLAGYTVMEKCTGWGGEYPTEVRNGEWEYQAFTAERNVNNKRSLTECFQCLKPLERDFTSLHGARPSPRARPRRGLGYSNQ